MLSEVTIREIERIFAVTDAMGIHREHVVIPLRPRRPGRVRRLPQLYRFVSGTPQAASALRLVVEPAP